KEARELFKLRAAERRIEIGKPIVESDFIVHIEPRVRKLSGGGKVLGTFADGWIIAQQSSAASGGHNLVAVKRQSADSSEGATMASTPCRAKCFRRVLDQR